MSRFGRWWWIVPAALAAILLKGLLLTAWVAGQVEDAALRALGSADLEAVEFVGVDGVGLDGLSVVLEGPAADEGAAIAAVEAEDTIATVIYRVFQGGATVDPAVAPVRSDPAEHEHRKGLLS